MGTVTSASPKKDRKTPLHVKGEGKFKVTLFHCETFISVKTSEFVSFENCFLDKLCMGEFLKWQLFANLRDCLVVPKK